MTYVAHPELLLTDRVAVVTGGAGGIGAATARLFAAHGANVVIADIDADLAGATAASITESGGSASAFVTDVRDPDQVTRLAGTVLDRFGRVDVLVNNVGHWLRHPGNFVKTDTQLWDELYRINLHHVFLLTHAFLPTMVERRRGAIVNVSSVEGLRGYPEDPVYAAFKAAVNAFTRSLAVQVGNDGVRVNAIAPDVTESLQVPYRNGFPPRNIRNGRNGFRSGGWACPRITPGSSCSWPRISRGSSPATSSPPTAVPGPQADGFARHAGRTASGQIGPSTPDQASPEPRTSRGCGPMPAKGVVGLGNHQIRPSVKAPARDPEGIGSLSTDHQQPTGIEYLRGRLLYRVDAQPFEDWSPALLRALIAVFDLNGVTPAAQHGFRPHVVR